MYATINLQVEGRLAYLELNRPHIMNAMDDVMMKELAEALKELKNSRSVQVVIIKGAGKTFSAGGDIQAMMTMDESFDMRSVMKDVGAIASALYELPQITIAAVHGSAAGLGFSLVLGCDTIIVEESAKMAMNFIGIGLIPDGAGHFFLKERMGVPATKQLIWSGEVMDAEKAKERGLADTVVPDGQASQAAEELAHKVMTMPIASMIATKKILHAQKQEELARCLQLEENTQIEMRKTKDHLEGIQAFLEKRKPKFTGQ